MIQIQIDPSLDFLLDQSTLQKAGQVAMDRCQPDQNSDLSIILTDENKIKELNRDYRKIDDVTDVLSFPSMDIDPDSGDLYLGDIIIALPIAKKQAELAGHSVFAELQLLAVHGILHLLGYDHTDPAEKASMWQMQESILDELGLAGIKIITDKD